MKELEEIKANQRLTDIAIAPDGIAGNIHMDGWRGSVMASWGGGWDHVSVAPRRLVNVPSWEDMCIIKDIFFRDDETVVQYHPRADRYVNVMPNCLHLWRPQREPLPEPPMLLV